MIAYTTIGATDLARATSFYDELLGTLGAKKTPFSERMVAWNLKDGAMLAVCTPYDEKPATGGNGTMVAINLGTADKVGAFYAKAIELGGRDEGEPGLRGGGPFYGAYFRDLDNNKICAFCMQS